MSVADKLARELGGALIDELAREFRRTLEGPRLERAVPMDLPVKKTLREICCFFARVGFGNRYFAEESEIEIIRVRAVTLHAVDSDGNERHCQVVLDPEWNNPDT